MSTITVITHADQADIGLIAEIARRRDHALRVVQPYRGEQLPDLAEVDAVVALGGPQSAYENHPYLRDEERYLATAVDAGMPVLGICLGSQLLAQALGGTAHPGETGLEVGIIQVKPVDGATEPGIAGEFFSFHTDSMTPPPDAEMLAASDRYLQGWSSGSALAIQFHPELTLAGIRYLLRLETEKLARSGVDVAAMQIDVEQYFAAGLPDSRAVLTPWFDQLTPDHRSH